MKTKSLILALLFCCIASFAAQPAAAQTHSATATWNLSTDDTTAACAAPSTCSQNGYKAPGVCSTTSVFTQFTSLSATATTFTDATITPGKWCYAVTFVLNGSESIVFLSGNTNFATVNLPPATQTNLSVVAK